MTEIESIYNDGISTIKIYENERLKDLKIYMKKLILRCH